MNKFIIVLTSVLALTACGGGSGGGGNGAPGKSAYEIWLDQGNTGTEQDFLDSLVSGTSSVSGGTQYASLLQEAQAKGGYTITQVSWPQQGDFYRIEKNITDIANGNNTTSGNDSLPINKKITYNEKELNLANYGVMVSENIERTEFGNELYKTYVADTWINNREGVGANVYTPANNTVFTGSTMAYLYDGSKLQLTSYQAISSTSTNEPIFIKGSAEYTYSPTNPKLILDFDNYYRFVFQNGVSVTFSGTNNTGNTRYNLAVGSTFNVNNNEITTDINSGKIGFVKKDSVEEVVGTYDVAFKDYEGDKIYAPNGDFRLIGAFGGTKQ